MGIGVFRAVTLALALSCGTTSVAQNLPNHISVVGEGTATATPDMLRISLSVQATAAEASSAMRDMASNLDAVLAALTASGIPAEDTQTSGINLSPQYANTYETNEPPRITGFIAASDITIVSRDVDASGDILDAVVAAGATQLNSLSFDVQDRDALEEQARRAAIADGMAKTALFAQSAQVTLGDIIALTEGTAGGGRPQVFEAIGARSVAIAPGTIDVTATVTITTAIAAE